MVLSLANLERDFLIIQKIFAIFYSQLYKFLVELTVLVTASLWFPILFVTFIRIKGGMSSMKLPKRNTNNSKNAAKDEKENESQVITMAMIKSLFHELFEEQEAKLAETIKSSADVTNKRIDKLSADIIKNIGRLAELTNDVNDVKESIRCISRNARKKNGYFRRKNQKRKTKMSGQS